MINYRVMSLKLFFSVLCLFSVNVTCIVYDVTIVGVINEADGLGKIPISMVDAFEGLNINLVPTRPPSYWSTANVSPSVKKVLARCNNRAGKIAILTDILWDKKCNPASKVPLKSDIKLAYTMLESSEIPEEWVSILNNDFDAALVPDEYQKVTYERSGVTIPVFIVPLMMNLHELFIKAIPKKKTTPFIFGNLGAAWVHKNPILLIKAFNVAFGNSQDVKLIINARGVDKKVSQQIKKVLGDLNVTNIDFKVMNLSWSNYIDLFNTFNCYVNLSKGEGFSFSPREALALGIPTIISNNSAHGTICKAGYVKAVTSELEEPAYYTIFNKKCGSFFNCSLEDTVDALKEVYQEYDTYVAKAQGSRDWLMQYDFSSLKNKYRMIASPKKILFGDENKLTDNELITNSKKLYTKYCKLMGRL